MQPPSTSFLSNSSQLGTLGLSLIFWVKSFLVLLIVCDPS